MNKFWERVFYVLTYLTQGPSYLSPSAYAIMHRMHHAYTDTELDPHSPSYSRNVLDMMWKTRRTYQDIFDRKVAIEERFLKNVPVWEGFEKIAHSNWSRLVWAGIYIFCFAWFSTSPWIWILLPFALVMGPLHGAIINWYAHKYGYINFKQRNTAHNLLHVDFLMLGESYHNNHHQYPSSSNFGRRWHEIDPVYPVIKLLSWLRIISVKKNMMPE